MEFFYHSLSFSVMHKVPLDSAVLELYSYSILESKTKVVKNEENASSVSKLEHTSCLSKGHQ